MSYSYKFQVEKNIKFFLNKFSKKKKNMKIYFRKNYNKRKKIFKKRKMQKKMKIEVKKVNKFKQFKKFKIFKKPKKG